MPLAFYRFHWYCSLFLLIHGSAVFAQDSLQRKPLLRKSSLIAIPIVFYTPETRLAGGGAMLYTFRPRGQSDAARPSQVQLVPRALNSGGISRALFPPYCVAPQSRSFGYASSSRLVWWKNNLALFSPYLIPEALGGAYTQEKQVLSYLPFQLFFAEDAWQVKGELGYYRYVYQFFGIGNNTSAEDKERYDAHFPRLRLNLLRLVAPRHYLGLRYWWDNYQVVNTADGGRLMQGGITGSVGGVISALGLLWNYDSRDQVFFPTGGMLVEAEAFANSKVLGSNFNFSRLSIDAAAYFSKNEKNVLALNAWLVSLQGAPPFQQLAFIGGPKKMRGYFEGRLRDRNLWMLQAEYRRLLDMAVLGRRPSPVPGPYRPAWRLCSAQQCTSPMAWGCASVSARTTPSTCGWM